VGKPLQVFVVKEQRQAFHTKLTQLQSEDEKIVREWRIRMQPRKAPPFPAALTVSLGRDAKGRLVGLRWLLRDVTERERLEALQETEQQLRGLVHEQERQLIISDRLVSFAELTASLAHEFNNPLEIILGFAQDLLTEVDPQHPHYQPLQMIENEASRCKKLMRDLMGFARPINTQPRLTDLQDVVGKSLDLVSGQLQKGKINIAVEVQTDLPQIYADAQQLEQVLLNLYFNAIEAMPEGGVLTVRVTAKSAKAVVMTVTDTGLGIHPHDLPNIYRPFFTAKKTKGMGLGLSVCESIMKTHGGKIKVESLPGRGTTFHLYLPVERRTGDRNFRSHSRRGR
jgi:signal transduction histidine kinase